MNKKFSQNKKQITIDKDQQKCRTYPKFSLQFRGMANCENIWKQFRKFSLKNPVHFCIFLSKASLSHVLYNVLSCKFLNVTVNEDMLFAVKRQ